MRLKVFTIPAMALVASVSVAFPSRSGEQWTQYVNHQTISCLADAGAHLWLASQGGLIRLDKASGEKTYFNRANTILPAGIIRSLVSDGRGRLWAITLSGALGEYNGSAWSNPGATGPLRRQAVMDLAWDGRGSLWVLALDSGSRETTVFRKKGDQWLRMYLDGAPQLSLGSGYYGTYANQAYVQAAEDGHVWVVVRASHTKLFRIQPDGIADTVPVPAHLHPELFIVPRSGNPFWICQREIARPAAEGWKTQPLPAGMFYRYTAGAYGTYGGYYGSYYGGLNPHPRHLYAQAGDGSEYLSLRKPMRLRGETWEELPVLRDSLQAFPLFLHSGTGSGPSPGEERLWAAGGERLGSLTGGAWSIQQVGNRPFGKFNPTAILPRLRNRAQVLIAGSNSVAAFDPVAGSATPPLDLGIEWGYSSIVDLAEDDAERVWIKGTSGLARLASDGKRVFTPGNSPWKGGNAYSRATKSSFLAVDARRTVWVVDSDKLISIPEGTSDTTAWTLHTVPSLPGNTSAPLGIARHRDGSLWIAAGAVLAGAPGWNRTYLARYAGKAWTIFDSTQHAWIGNGSMQDFRCDAAGNLWLLGHQGMLQWDGKAWREHAAGQSVYLRSGFRSMAVDGAGQLWVATGAPEVFLLKWHGDGWTPMADMRERFPTVNIARMAFDADGRLWMTTTTDGLLLYDPAGTPTTKVTVPSVDAERRRLSLRRATDGSWRIIPGELAGEDALSLRVLDLNGREVAGTGTVLRRSFGEPWSWAGVRPALAPGNYLLSLQGLQGRSGPRSVLPFRHAP